MVCGKGCCNFEFKVFEECNTQRGVAEDNYQTCLNNLEWWEPKTFCNFLKPPSVFSCENFT